MSTELNSTAVMAIEDLRDHGVLWAINRVLFHPRGYALALAFDGDRAIGWQLLGNGDETWFFEGDSEDAQFEAFEALLVSVGDQDALHDRLMDAEATDP